MSTLRSPERLKSLAYPPDPAGRRRDAGEDLVSVRELVLIPGRSYELAVKVAGEPTRSGVTGLFHGAPCRPLEARLRRARRSADSGIVVGAHACALTAGAGTLLTDAGAASLAGVQCIPIGRITMNPAQPCGSKALPPSPAFSAAGRLAEARSRPPSWPPTPSPGASANSARPRGLHSGLRVTRIDAVFANGDTLVAPARRTSCPRPSASTRRSRKTAGLNSHRRAPSTSTATTAPTPAMARCRRAVRYHRAPRPLLRRRRR